MVTISYGISKRVDDSIINSQSDKHRDYLGASLIGEECHRKIWYMYNMPKKIQEARVLRIFRLGDLIEDLVIKMLKDAGYTVYEKDKDGNQFGFKHGKFAGHIDGVITGLEESTKPHLLEIKSANDKRFKDFVNKGYRSSSTYFAQIQVYMLFMKLERALVVVYNKNNSELYFERIQFDKLYAEMMVSKAETILESSEEPERAYPKSNFWKCKFCDYKKECWE